MSVSKSRRVYRGVTLVMLGASALVCGCTSAVIGRPASPTAAATDAVLILPGFGYGRAGEHVFQALAPPLARAGMDLFVPAYISRAGLVDSRARLQHFIREHRLDRYERLHVFAFIAGGWTLNPAIETQRLPNLATVVYDRSPLQERAPRIADEHLHFLTWVRYGSPVFDVAHTPYPPLTAPNVKVGLMVETLPTAFIKGHEQAARSYGPLRFDCDAFTQRRDDCLYLPMNHDELYVRFAEVWPEMLTFIRTGRFTSGANRTPPSGDPLADSRRR